MAGGCSISLNWKTPGGGAGDAASADYAPTVLSTMPGFVPTAVNTAKSFPSQAAFAAAARAAIAAGKPLDLIAIASEVEAVGATNVFARFHSDDASEANAAMRPRLILGFSANPLPEIATGAAPSATAGVAVSLAGSVGTGASQVAWTKVSGPGAVEFSQPGSATTEATFGSRGSYVLRLQADGPLGTVSKLLQLEVTGGAADPATYSGWQQETWPGAESSAEMAADQDPDGDGMNNLLEWALHRNARQSDQPSQRLERSVSPGLMEFRYTRRKVQAGQATFLVEWSDTLGDDWSTIGVGEEITSSIDGTSESVSVQVPFEGANKRFVRVKVDLLPR